MSESNNESVSQVFMLIRSRLSRLVSRIAPPREVEDIVQETYVRVCLVEREEIRYPRSFLYRTAKNLALDYVKKAETRLVGSIDEEEEADWGLSGGREDETYDKAVANQEFGFFCEAVRQLPQQCRKAFVLKKVYGYSQKEIASNLDISESTVEKHIASGIRRCGEFMAKYESETSLRFDEGSRGGL